MRGHPTRFVAGTNATSNVDIDVVRIWISLRTVPSTSPNPSFTVEVRTDVFLKLDALGEFSIILLLQTFDARW